MRVKGKVDFVITDAPIIQGILYANKFEADLPASYAQFVVDSHNQILSPSVNILIERSFEYKAEGRYQTEEVAKELDIELEQLLIDSGVTYAKIKPDDVAQYVLDKTKETK